MRSIDEVIAQRTRPGLASSKPCLSLHGDEQRGRFCVSSSGSRASRDRKFESSSLQQRVIQTRSSRQSQDRRRNPQRDGLSAGGRWIQTIGSCRKRSRFILRKANCVGIGRGTKEICGVPMVRIHLPPAGSLLRTGLPVTSRRPSGFRLRMAPTTGLRAPARVIRRGSPAGVGRHSPFSRGAPRAGDW